MLTLEFVFILAAEIDSIAWFRCASGNVMSFCWSGSNPAASCRCGVKRCKKGGRQKRIVNGHESLVSF